MAPLKTHLWIGIFWICWGIGQAAAAQASPVPVIVKTLSPQPVSSSLEALGTLRANESVVISSTVTDTITAIHFDDEQWVDAGDVLVEMTNGEEQALLDEAQSAVAESERQYQRVKKLMKTDSTSESLLDQRRVAFQSAKARLAATRSRLQDRLIIAPFSGRVGLRNISVGALVTPGDVITTLDDVATLKLDIILPATALPLIHKDMPITAQARALGENDFSGTVRSIDTRVDPVTRAVTVRAVIKNPELVLRPGMLMSVKLQSPSRQALLIPEEALVRERYNEYVYVIAQQDSGITAERRTIKTGERMAGDIVVVHGLNAGEQVITHGMLKIKSGSPVSIRAEEKNDEPLEALLKNPS